MTDEINIELVEPTPLDIEFTETQLTIDLVEPESIQIDFIEQPPLTIDLVEPSPIEIEFPNVGIPGVGVPPGGTTGQVLAKVDADDYDTEWVDQSPGGGAVDSVNGQTGVVVLDATDVGADPSGSASTALTSANNYTDTQIGALTFLESIVAGSGVTVDNTDPQNPIVSATALPTQIYLFQNEETTPTYVYVGYEAVEGDWYIYRRTRSTNTREYAFGASAYSTNWNNRASLTYN